MPIRIKPDLIRGATASGNLQELVVVRSFEVSGLSEYPSEARTLAAIQARDQVTGFTIPIVGESFPNSINTGLIWVAGGNNASLPSDAVADLTAIDIRTDEVSWDIVNVLVLYRRRRYPAPYLKSVQGSIREVDRVLFNGSGSLITIGYTRQGSSTKVSVPAFFKKRFVDAVITFRRLELVDSEFFNRIFAGCVNDINWRGYGPRECMILPSVSTTDDNIIFNNQYSILIHEDTHDDFLYYLDINGDMPLEVAMDIDYTDLTLGSKKKNGTDRNGWCRMIGGRGLTSFSTLFPWLEGNNNVPNTYGLDPTMVYNST